MSRATPTHSSLWRVSGSGNIYQLIRKEPPFDYVLHLVERGPKAQLGQAIGDQITVTFDWFGERAARVSEQMEMAK